MNLNFISTIKDKSTKFGNRNNFTNFLTKTISIDKPISLPSTDSITKVRKEINNYTTNTGLLFEGAGSTLRHVNKDNKTDKLLLSQVPFTRNLQFLGQPLGRTLQGKPSGKDNILKDRPKEEIYREYFERQGLKFIK
jgi:hypothetical protein